MPKKLILVLALAGAFGAPAGADAAVVINEICWMGTSDNANAEWIELANTGADSVSLAGWKLTSSTGAPSITISGTIEAGGYYLLERTSVTNITGVTGDQAYTGALSNAGATLTLADATGASMDEVVGGTNWANVGGDNISKQTAQRSAGSWITATPTPRAANAAGSSDTTTTATTTPSDTITATTTSPSIAGNAITYSGSNPIPRLYVDAGSGRTVSTGADTPYSALVYDSQGQVRTDPRVYWNFGDGTHETGYHVQHTYATAGLYIVIIRAETQYTGVSTALTVRADDAGVRVGGVASGGITLHNDSTRMVDLSGWRLAAGKGEFVFPLDTAMLPLQSVTFAPSVTGLATTTDDVTLRYPNDTIADAYASSTEALADAGIELTPVKLLEASAGSSRVSVVEPIVAAPSYEAHLNAPTATTEVAAVGAAMPSATSTNRLGTVVFSPWTASFAGVVLVSGAALLLL